LGTEAMRTVFFAFMPLCRIARTAFPSGHAIVIDRVLVFTGKFMQWNISINKGGSITGVFPPQGDANHT
jgi:hypothetical protein